MEIQVETVLSTSNHKSISVPLLESLCMHPETSSGKYIYQHLHDWRQEIGFW